MSTGKVIGGKLAIRNGRLACDCCDQEPPPGGACQCGVAPPGFDTYTAHFDNCIGDLTPSNPPPVLPGEEPSQFGPNYATDGWNAPTVQLLGSMSQTETITSTGFNRSYTCSIPFGTLLRVKRATTCMVFDEYRPLEGDPFYTSRTRIPYTYQDDNETIVDSMDVSLGDIQMGHLYGFPNGVANPDCTPSETNESLNLSLVFRPRLTTPGASGVFRFSAATGNQNPCYGTGLTESTANVQVGAFIESAGVSFGGSCSSFTVLWSGSSALSIGVRNYTFNWSVRAIFSGMVGCPEGLTI